MIWYVKKLQEHLGNNESMSSVLGSRNMRNAGNPRHGETQCPLCGTTDTDELRYSTYALPDYYCKLCGIWYTKDATYSGDAMSRLST